MTAGLALKQLMDDMTGDFSNVARYWMIAMAVVYFIGTLCALSIVFHHWKTSVSTTASE